MTVTYSSPNFDVRDAVHTVADLVTAKGSAISTSDNVYIRTDTSAGTLRVGPAEAIECNIYVGWTVGKAADSEGNLQIDGGGVLRVPVAGHLQVNPYYGTLKTGSTSRGTEAEIDAQECSNDLSLRGAWDVEHLKIENIKSGGYIDIQDAYGTVDYLTVYGKSGAAYSFKGVPETGFHVRAADLGRVNTGFFTVSGEPDIDLVNDGVYLHGTKSRNAQHEVVPIPGRRAARVLSGVINPTAMKLSLRINSNKIENISRDIDYIVSRRLQVLVVTRAHGSSGDYPIDMLFRARIVTGLQPDLTGIDHRDMTIDVEGDE